MSYSIHYLPWLESGAGIYYGCGHIHFFNFIFFVVNRLHKREEYDITNRVLVCEKHGQTVYADSNATCRRHTHLKSVYEVFIHALSLFITPSQSFFLLTPVILQYTWII